MIDKGISSSVLTGVTVDLGGQPRFSGSGIDMGAYEYQWLATENGMHTIRSGTWSDPTIWSGSRLPVRTDQVTVKHLVTISASFTANAVRVFYEAGGKLSFEENSQLKLGF